MLDIKAQDILWQILQKKVFYSNFINIVINGGPLFVKCLVHRDYISINIILRKINVGI